MAHCAHLAELSKVMEALKVVKALPPPSTRRLTWQNSLAHCWMKASFRPGLPLPSEEGTTCKVLRTFARGRDPRIRGS